MVTSRIYNSVELPKYRYELNSNLQPVDLQLRYYRDL